MIDFGIMDDGGSAKTGAKLSQDNHDGEKAAVAGKKVGYWNQVSDDLSSGNFKGDVSRAIPYGVKAGSPQAAEFWNHVADAAKKAGMYRGKGLEGNDQYIIDKMKVVRGMDDTSATKVAANIKAKLIQR
jgi:hypothetical protein